MSKPRIYRSSGKWWCSQGRFHAFARKPTEAYHAMVRQQEVMLAVQQAWKDGRHERSDACNWVGVR